MLNFYNLLKNSIGPQRVCVCVWEGQFPRALPAQSLGLLYMYKHQWNTKPFHLYIFLPWKAQLIL